MLTEEEKVELKRRYPAHWFCKIVRNGVERIVAIPKREEITPVPSLPGLTLDMLHGSTIYLGGRT